MSTTLHPLLQRQPHPFPYYQRLSEEMLKDKGIISRDTGQ